MSWLPLAAVTLLALLLNVWALTRSGYGNTYYAAAARSMSESWHNFFFAAFDPGGFITVDKPPVFLWIDALSVRLFGFSSLALLLPSAIAGAAAVALLWLIVRRHFGVLAATIAGLVLATTPIAVAVNRLNLPEPFYILALIGAAGCVLQSLEGRRWLLWTAAAGLLVGVAFNTKMLAGWIPGPALALAIVVGVEGTWRSSWRRWVPRLLVLGAVTLAASASWMLVVDTWPASERPYIGGSRDNTVQDLAFGYNGLDRVEGENVGPGGPPRPGAGGAPNGAPGGVPRNAPPPGPARGPGGIIAGEPGWLRMFDAANGGQIAWFLPFATIGAVIGAWHWRSNRVLRSAVVLWLGWVLLYGAVFSFQEGIYHSYYTAAMAPGIAALAGMSTVAIADLARRHPLWTLAAMALVLATLAIQMTISGRFDGFYDWVEPYAVVGVVAGLLLTLACALTKRLPVSAGIAVALVGLLLLPLAWSSHEAANASLNTTLPQAGPRQGAAGRSFGSNSFDGGVAGLAAWLRTNGQGDARWNLVVSGAQNASTLIARYDLSVLALGGFSGRDPTITAAQFAELVKSGDARYVLTTGPFGGPPPGGVNRDGGFQAPAPVARVPMPAGSAKGANAVMAAVQATCKPVVASTLPAQYRGALYDCAGSAGALASR